MKHLFQLLLKLLGTLPFIGEPMRVVSLDRQLRALEKENAFQAARELRKKAFSKISISHQGPILRSEGEDRLYRLNDYRGALETFERAISVMGKSASLYGVTSRDRVYAGASQAALKLGDSQKAQKYYHEFAKMVAELSANPKLHGSLAWHTETLRRIESQINSKNNKKKSNG
jgi:tetratricopeptide (TPR) repeat protein